MTAPLKVVEIATPKNENVRELELPYPPGETVGLGTEESSQTKLTGPVCRNP